MSFCNTSKICILGLFPFVKRKIQGKIIVMKVLLT
eukprot:UN13163